LRPLLTLKVRPALPPALAALEHVAHNLWWCWHEDATELFARLDRDEWERSGHNPVLTLSNLSQDRLIELSDEAGFLAHLHRVTQSLDEYMAERPVAPGTAAKQIAYFSLEFGIHESVPIYSGGMGLLAGDHLRSASDLNLPFVGVSLLYREGYFRQYLNPDGWQLERYYDNDFSMFPLTAELGPDGQQLTIEVDFPGRVCRAAIWRMQVGRVPLYLLDANLPENQPQDRDVTRRLYQGDNDMRIRQEILLGVGGLRALARLGVEPTVCHMNEGHAAFLGLERIRALMCTRAMNFAEARELAMSGNVFTTHTPVPAGIDVFSADLVDQYLGPIRAALGISRDELLGLGRQNPFNLGEGFSMAVLAIRLADHVNGVSRLHGEVSRAMWRGVWPDVPVHEVPIGSITNGVHTQFWTCGSEVSRVFDRYLGTGWREDPQDSRTWSGAYQIPAEELWRAHERDRARLVSFVRLRARQQAEQRGSSLPEVAAAGEILDPGALTIGFARRFATYKRALLLFRDIDRLIRIVSDPHRRVQFVIAGKAHPQDLAGRELIRAIVQTTRKPELANRIVFVENYDIDVARMLVQGVDLWLTNPRRPHEASGTSGMKVAFNAGLNASVLDGWWVEGYRPEIGWVIGQGEVFADENYQDEIESRAIYNLLEKEIVPLFYERAADGVPRSWVGRLKASAASLCPVFNTHRMLREYDEIAYEPAATRFAMLGTHDGALARDLAAWKLRMWRQWHRVTIQNVTCDRPSTARIGDSATVRAVVFPGELASDDLCVELVSGRVDANGQIEASTVERMMLDRRRDDGSLEYNGTTTIGQTGTVGYTVRALPNHREAGRRIEPGLIAWAS